MNKNQNVLQSSYLFGLTVALHYTTLLVVVMFTHKKVMSACIIILHVHLFICMEERLCNTT